MRIFFIALAIIATTCAESVSNDYLPPHEEYSVAGSNAYETNALEVEPAHSLSDDGYRYKTVKRYRLRHRRDVNELTTSYLPPQAASAAVETYAGPAEEVSIVAESAPEIQSVEASYESAASVPAHTLADDGYHYKTVKRYRLRHRRDVNELTTSYLPPQAASAQVETYAAPAQEASIVAESAPEVSLRITEPQAVVASFESAASEPAHILANDGYRYKTVKRYRLRHRRDVNELNSYLPPQAASAAVESYAAPAHETAIITESVPEVQSVETSYESAASEPAHTLAADGYRYKTVKRYRLRHRRDVNELTSYLPPQAASAAVETYAAPAQEASIVAESALEVAHLAPESIDVAYQTDASVPAHTLADDGYRYKTVKRYRLRHRQ